MLFYSGLKRFCFIPLYYEGTAKLQLVTVLVIFRFENPSIAN